MEQHSHGRGGGPHHGHHSFHNSAHHHQGSSHQAAAAAVAAQAAAAMAAAANINAMGHQVPLLPHLPPPPPPAAPAAAANPAAAAAAAAAGVLPQQMIIAGVRKDCIRLRGLPYEAGVEHILEFLGDHAKSIVYQGVHMVYNTQVGKAL